MANDWLKVVVTSRAEEAGAVDDVLEEVGLRHISHDGEAWDACVVCDTTGDLVATRLALPEGVVKEVSEEDLRILLRDAGQADLAREVLRDTPAASGEVQLVRHLRVYARDQQTVSAIRAGVAARVAAGSGAVMVL